MVMRTPPQRGMLQDGKGGVRRVPLSRAGLWGRLGVPVGWLTGQLRAG